MNLNDKERKILEYLADESGDYGYCNFGAIHAETRIDRKAIRRACRSLTRKGLAQFGKGLWTEDGEPAGSGYAATEAGVVAIYGPR